MGRKTRDTTGVQKQAEYPRKLYHRLSVLLLLGYLIGVVLFYFLAGEQLHFRESRGNVEMPGADSTLLELSEGMVIEQRFVAKIERLEQVSVQWATFLRPNAGTVLMELCDLRDGSVILSESFDAAAIPEGGLTVLEAETPLEGLWGQPLSIRLTSPDGQPGSSLWPKMSGEKDAVDGQLLLNGELSEKILCFSANGADYIWTGLHYWKLAGCGLVLVLLLLCLIGVRCKKGKHGSYIVNAILAVGRYRFLIRQLVSRDFKTKYKRSVLGMFWSFLNPLLMMCVQYVVFSTIFKSDIPNYAVYLLIGIVSFNFFSEACGMALGSIVGNASLITKVYMPKYIYPLTRVLSSVVNLSISLIPLLIVFWGSGLHFQKSAVLSLYFLVCLILFSLGLGLLLSAAMVYFRDMQFLWNILSMIWMYLTPIFYPESILPENLRGVLQANPLYHFLKSLRLCLLGGVSPEPMAYVQCMLMALGMLTVGALVFRKAQDRFAIYL